MKRCITTLFIILFLLAFLEAVAFSADYRVDTKTFQSKKQPELQQIKPRKPVKIKLKRSGEGKYSWDLAGDDVDEIVRADKRLKKLLNVE